MSHVRLASELEVGDKASIVHTMSEVDLALFAAATGDVNPIHFDQTYAESTFFKGRIAHGMLCAGILSSVLADQLPGLGTIYVSQNLRFLAPVKIGDQIKAEVEVLEVDRRRNRVTLRTSCSNQAGVLVVDGEAVVAPPKNAPAADLTEGMAERAAGLTRKLDTAVRAFEQAAQRTD